MNSIHTLQATDFNSRIFEIIRKDDITLEKESNDVSVFDTNLNRNILENSLKQIKSRIEEINENNIKILKENTEQFENEYKNSLETYDSSVAYLTKINTLIKDINEEEGIKTRIDTLIKEREEIKEKISHSQKIGDLLTQIQKIYQCIKNIEEEIYLNDYIKATENLISLTTQSRSISSEYKNIKIIKELKENVTRLNDLIKGNIEDIISKFFIFNDSDDTDTKCILTVNKKLIKYGKCQNDIFLSDILYSIYKLETIQYHLSPFFKSFKNLLLKPIIQNSQHQLELKENNEQSMILESTINDSYSKSWCTKTEPEESIYTVLLRLFKYIEDNVFDFSTNTNIDSNENKEEIKHEYLKEMGNYIEKTCIKLIINNYLEKSIPSYTSDLDSFDNITAETKNYEEFLKSKGLISEHNYELSQYCDEIDIHFTNQKHNLLMQKVQKLLSSTDYELELIEESSFSQESKIFENDSISQKASELSQMSNNKDKITEFSFNFEQNFITFPRCCIDSKTKQLLELVFNTLKEASNMTSPCLYRLYYSIRDVFDYYRAVVPVLFAENIKNNLEFCAIFHNDCMYISHYLMLMSFQNRELFLRIAEYEKQNKKHIENNREVKQHVTLLDLINQFRKLGEKFFNNQLCNYKKKILDTIRSTSSFEMNDFKRVEVVTNALNEVKDHLQKLSMAWKPILPAYMYLDVMGKVYDLTLKELIRQIQRLSDITMDDSEKLNELFDTFRDCDDMFDKLLPNKELDDILKVYVPHYKKFDLITDILMLKLAEIMGNFREGYYDGTTPEVNSDGNLNPYYLMDGFYPDELIKLIRALFSDSALRSKSIDEIKNAKK
ncbi:Zw10-domain-containing protein [Neocallimastix lanati (nom. inval.)]|jgi:hypothetical protein|uniref:Zw10-domain-containing protein n=1 Tax=Neocallimastix californiae TaxID=1754190 RepID=A0A1Y1ZIZ4_9FUNG|nr:Zw10-domain-containing protein [Neocallimastix sp. JGI-2020a]ORY10223.1 Zw10-domain-containing protein [Neocallimastix californiae]|eukprot:ORY10223.1 Zw10-domain-containing protein [Neocallimastix californiae]